ncbi:MAG: Na+/H+ antiporter NhaC family protein [Calditrichaeota bacterium]|nr:MAG: Na+/H+ antiporter NhaC family protein [Calditrichota bacterium]
MAHQGDSLHYQIKKADSGELLKEGEITINDKTPPNIVIDGLKISHSGKKLLHITLNDYETEQSIRILPAFVSILPPLFAITLALITRQVIVALFFGIWLGVTFLYDYNPFLGFLHTLDEYIVNAMASREHVFILVFSLVLGGMVGVISRSGGTQGIVEKLSKLSKNSRGGQIATWLMGVLIFFDDYANTLIVGNTMRPLTDKLRISREKLSYLVDSTAAPVANIAIISTWIGYEISLINDALLQMGMTDNAYILFLRTIPFNFYPIYTLIFGLMIAVFLRDFGPMWKAERRTQSTGAVLSAEAVPLADLGTRELLADENTPRRWYNALIPVGMVILVVSIGLFYTGWDAGMAQLAREATERGVTIGDLPFIRRVSAIIGESDSFAVLMWAAFTGSITAIIMALSQRLLSLQQALEAWVNGIRSMVMAAIILTSAWAIGNICGDLFTADYVVHLTQKFLSPHWLPLITFITSGVIAFATGTSWGTMAILMPIALPLAHKFPLTDPTIDATHAMGLLLSTTAAVLAGATFGDHCSPISDTTIMSSMASGADHIDHVRTQLPYALSSATVAILLGYIPVGFGISNWIVLPLGIVAIVLLIRFLGKPIQEESK